MRVGHRSLSGLAVVMVAFLATGCDRGMDETGSGDAARAEGLTSLAR